MPLILALIEILPFCVVYFSICSSVYASGVSSWGQPTKVPSRAYLGHICMEIMEYKSVKRAEGTEKIKIEKIKIKKTKIEKIKIECQVQ